MLIFFIFFPLVVYIPVGIYLYFFFGRFLTLFQIEKKSKKSRRLSILFAVICAALGWQVYGLAAVIILHFLALCIIMEVLNAVLKRRLKSEKAVKNWSFLYRSGIVSIILIILIMGYGYINIGQVRRTEYQLETKKELEHELKIVQISDLHMGTAMNLTKLEQYCDEIAAENPDILALTGDIFDESTKWEEMEAAAELLAGIETKYGIYYVFGNHDYNSYRITPNYTADELRSTLTEKGIQILEEVAVTVADGLVIAGRTDISAGRGELSQVIRDVPEDAYLLLLDHQPVELAENAAAGVDLSLSGHTHAGQIWPTGQLSELVGVVELNYGPKQIEDYQAIVSSGIAGWGYPIRTGGHSEYVVITLYEK